MKKLLSLILITIGIVTYPAPSSLASLTSYIGEGTYSVYLSGYARSDYAVRLDNGGDTVLLADIACAELVHGEAENVLGETVSFYGGQEELDKLVSVLGFSTVYEGEGEALCIYGKASALPRGVEVNGREVNCQIVAIGGKITVGYPLIMGSYDLDT